VVNEARVQALDASGRPVEHTDQASTPITLLSHVAITPGRNANVRAGETVIYRHTITNQGNFIEYVELQARDDLGWTLQLQAGADSALSTGSVVVGPIGVGDSVGVSLHVIAPPGAMPGEVDTAELEVRSTRVRAEVRLAQDVSTVVDAELQLLLRVEPQGPVPPGALLRYTLEFGNPDPQLAITQVHIRDVLDGKLAVPPQARTGTLMDLAVPGRQVDVVGSWDPGARAFIWTFASLPPGFRGELQLEARVAAPLPEGVRVDNTMSAEANGMPLQWSNAVSTPILPPLLDLAATTLTPEVEPGDAVLFELLLTNRSQANALQDVDVSFLLPPEFRYLDHGSSANGKPLGPVLGDGRQAHLQVSSLQPGEQRRWTFACAANERVQRGTHLADATAHATVFGDVGISAAAETPVHVVASLDLDGTIVGRVYLDSDRDAQPGLFEGLPNVRVVLADGTQSMTDDRGRFHFTGVRPGLHVLRVDHSNLPGDVEFDSEGRLAAGSRHTRFVDMQPGEIRKVNFRASRPDPIERPRFEIAAGGETWQMHSFSLFAPGETLLRPEAERMLSRLAARAEPLVLDEDTSPPPPGPGPSPFPSGEAGLAPRARPPTDVAARVLTTLDTELDEWTRQRLTSVHRALGIEVQTEDTAPPQPEQSLEERVRTMTPTPEILEPYDGAHAVRDRVRVLVKLPHGQRARLRVNGREVDAALVGTRVEAPQQNVTLLEYVGVPLRVGRNEILFSALEVERTIHVELAGPPAAIRLENESAPADGISEPRVRVRLVDAADRPVAHTRFVTVEAEGGVLGSDANPQADGFQVRLQRGAATLRLPPSVTTGDRRVLVRFADLAATTWVHMLPAPRDWIMAGVGEVSIAKRPEKQPLAPDEARTGADARAGLFAQGRVGGNGQLTLGVDTERQRDILFSQQERERLYPALGDAAPQQELAPSHWPVYARYDAPEGYAQLGDFRTGWADVELARFDRALSGFDAAWLTSRGRTRVHGFIAASRQRAAKDELQGLGTSGPYVLSKRPLYVHSERLFVETRHRIHTERVLSVRPLVRHADYTIDYSNGTLLLKEPLSGADADFNPIFLVVLYETLEERSSEPMWGVRGLTAWRGLQTGLVAVHEATGFGTGTLLGVDGTLSLRSDLALQYEYAHSAAATQDHAYSFAITGRGFLGTQGRAYYREIGPEFRNESRTGVFEQGTRKYGLESRVRLGRGHLLIDGYMQEDLTRARERYALSTDYERAQGPWSGAVGYRLTGASEVGQAQMASVVAARARRTFHGRVGLELGGQKAFGSALTSHPTRLSLGADARLTSKVGVNLRQEWDGSDTGRRATLFGLESRLTERTTLTSRLENIAGPSDRTAAFVGARTLVPLGRGWSVSARAERGRIFTEQSASSAALALGAQWRVDRRLLRFGYEGRASTSTSEHAAYMTTSLRFGSDWMLLGRERWQRTRLAGRIYNSHDLLVGWSYRPVRSDRLQWLARVRTLVNPAPSVNPELDFSRTVASVAGSLDLTSRYALAGGYAARLSHARADAAEAQAQAGISHLRLIYDLGRFDLSAGVRHRARNASPDDWSYGAEFGARLVRDVWLATGYNFAGFVDPDLPHHVQSGSSGYLRLRFKFDESILGPEFAR
jgi:hypothetical protein